MMQLLFMKRLKYYFMPINNIEQQLEAMFLLFLSVCLTHVLRHRSPIFSVRERHCWAINDGEGQFDSTFS